MPQLRSSREYDCCAWGFGLFSGVGPNVIIVWSANIGFGVRMFSMNLIYIYQKSIYVFKSALYAWFETK